MTETEKRQLQRQRKRQETETVLSWKTGRQRQEQRDIAQRETEKAIGTEKVTETEGEN